MIKITNELFEKFSKKQEELDSMIREKFAISESEWKNDLNLTHGIATKVEVAEFVNECHDVWKYWKQKPVKPEGILDEAVDVLHFMHLFFNKVNEMSTYENVDYINQMIDEYTARYEKDDFDIIGILSVLLTSKDFYQSYALLFMVLDHYAFTLDDIEQAYDRKNAENHARQERNY